MHEEGKTSISVDDFKKKMTGELTAQGYSTESDILYQEITRSGLLKAEGNTISFRHHLLQEFFAGRGIKDIPKVRNTQLKDSWWTKCFVFYFGEHPENAHDLRSLRIGLMEDGKKNGIIR
ncbi:MAG: hypothetical protein LC540_18440 [Candidatus Thiodiazotropha sp.]|nr:hypothetical protein [Candidatus Thiodiazotropha sp.]